MLKRLAIPVFIAVIILTSVDLIGAQDDRFMWVNNAQHDFWVKKPVEWRRADSGPAGDLAERFMEPVSNNAFVEIYAGKVGPTINADILANALEQKGLEYLQRRTSSEYLAVRGDGNGVMRRYQSAYQGETITSYALCIVHGQTGYTLVGVLRASNSGELEPLVESTLRSFGLTPPEGSSMPQAAAGRSDGSLPPGQIAELDSYKESPAPNVLINKPEGWTEDDPAGDPNIIRSMRDKDRGLSVAIMRANTVAAGSNQPEQVIRFFTKNDPLMQKRFSESALDTEYGTGAEIEFTGSDAANKRYRTLAHFIIIGQDCFMIMGRAPSSASEGDWDTVERAINSFRINK